jgi:5-(carboxyamino)imidazole ribonucleotide mutase
MPGGVPVATMAINGGRNAGLMAARILGISDGKLRTKILTYQKTLEGESKAKNRKLQSATKGYQGI